jgi:hypothetical protein
LDRAVLGLGEGLGVEHFHRDLAVGAGGELAQELLDALLVADHLRDVARGLG